MANIRDINKSAQKFVQRASVAQQQYSDGVQNPRRPWAAATAGAAQNFAAGVQAAVADGRFAKGVQKAGDQKWQANTLAKGPGRFVEGVSMAEGAWQTGFQPYQATIGALNLPPRGPRGSPQNLTRVAAVANALRDVKVKSGK